VREKKKKSVNVKESVKELSVREENEKNAKGEKERSVRGENVKNSKNERWLPN
jgi:hypothetical protein